MCFVEKILPFASTFAEVSGKSFNKIGGEIFMIAPRLTNEYENEILELIDHQDEYTRSDLQGKVTVLVNKIMESGFELLNDQKKFK